MGEGVSVAGGRYNFIGSERRLTLGEPVADSDFCTEDEITLLVHAFYARVREDELLGPIFGAHVEDWNSHLSKLVDFWSAVLLGTRRFNGAPMPKHAALPGLQASLFERWLTLFESTAAALPNRELGTRACAAAQRIAQSLWMGYQINANPSRTPVALQTRSGF